MYVPVYGKIWDDCSNNVAHTSSMKGKVESVNGGVLTHFGTSLEFCVSSEGEFKRMDEQEILRKIGYWASKNNLRWIKHYKEKLVKAKKHNEDVRNREKVYNSIHVRCEEKFKTEINDVKFEDWHFDLVDCLNKKNYKKLFGILKHHLGVDLLTAVVAEEV